MNVSETVGFRGKAQTGLHEEAVRVRNASSGNGVFVRAVVEVSNHCRQNCLYCGMRRTNHAIPRYRLDAEAMGEYLLTKCPDVVTDINIQTGEDPRAVEQVVLPLVKFLKQNSPRGISVSCGLLSPCLYAELHKAGATYYVLKFETGNPHSYKNLESPGSLERRLDAIRHLANTGWLVASGFISGLPGETPDDLALSMKTLLTLPLVGSSVSPLIPGEMTPLHGCPPGNLDTALNCVAIMRIASPSWIIPAVSAMAIEDRHGYARAFQAGANLATINLTPKRERTNFVIYKKDRRIMSLERVLAAMEEAGCEPCRIGISETLLSNLGE